jgi:glyoxylase I family protein
MIEAKFSHVGVMCIDPIKTEKFYTKYFNFRRTRVYAPGPEQVVMIKSGDIYLELFKADKQRPTTKPMDAGPEYPCWRHICFIVNDLDAKMKELESVAEVTLGPVDMGDFIKGMKVAWLRDPDGNIIELNQGYIDEVNPPQLK